MDRFEIVGSRMDNRFFHVDISYKDTPKEFKALDALLGTILDETNSTRANLGADDSQRYAFNRLVDELLQFMDGNNFRETIPGKDRQKRLRVLATSVNKQMTKILQEHRGRKVLTLSLSRPVDPPSLLKTIHKVLTK
jgi:hypothetical protein